MHPRSLAIILALAANAGAQVVSYEAISFPEDVGWERDTFCNPERSLVDGWLVQHVETGECGGPPGGDRDSYTRSITGFAGGGAFFVVCVI